jgi:hypothetical protein
MCQKEYSTSNTKYTSPRYHIQQHLIVQYLYYEPKNATADAAILKNLRDDYTKSKNM